MNIFYLDTDVDKCAEYHCDKHVIKMILETAQLLSSAHHVLGTPTPLMYKKTHVNHPSAKWVRESIDNYMWAYDLFSSLSHQYFLRYGKVHKSYSKLVTELVSPPSGLATTGFTHPPQCMPDQYKCKDTVEAYRNYYKGAKASFCTWKNSKPEWFV